MAVIIKGVSYAPKIKNSTLLRYSSERKQNPSEIIALLENGSPVEMVGLFIFAAKVEGVIIQENDIWDEVDERVECFTEMAEHFTNELMPKVPEKSGTKKK